MKIKKTREDIQTDCLNIMLQHKRGTAAVSMGVGKTLIGLKYVDYFQDKNMRLLRVLVVAPKLSIFNSWKDDAVKFNISVANIEFTTYLSLHKQNPLNYDIIILDECHSLLYSHMDFLSEFKGRILGLTGTPPKWRQSEKGEMVNKFCPVLYNYITDEAVLDNILNDYKIIIHMLPLDGRKNIKMQSKAGKTWMASELDNYRYWSDRVMSTQGKSQQIASVMRMKKMQEFKSKELYAKTLFDAIEDKCILFANTQEQADRLCEHSYHSNNPDSEGNLDLFGNDHITKLSCVLQLSEGVNIPNLRAGVIMHAYGNERKSSQRIGRLLRLNPNDVATVHILCYQNTVDKKWITDALSVYDDNKITYIKDNKIFIRESN